MGKHRSRHSTDTQALTQTGCLGAHQTLSSQCCGDGRPHDATRCLQRPRDHWVRLDASLCKRHNWMVRAGSGSSTASEERSFAQSDPSHIGGSATAAEAAVKPQSLGTNAGSVLPKAGKCDRGSELLLQAAQTAAGGTRMQLSSICHPHSSSYQQSSPLLCSHRHPQLWQRSCTALQDTMACLPLAASHGRLMR